MRTEINDYNRRALIALLATAMENLDEKELTALSSIIKEVQRAKIKHPAFAQGGLFYMSNIITEEQGEMAREVNHFFEDNTAGLERIEEELSHVGATAVRAMAMVLGKEAEDFKN